MYDLIVIGAGPGGMDTAIEAHKQGLSVLVVEKDKVGGTCLNRGCIPTKALLHWADLSDKIREVSQSGVFSPFEATPNPYQINIYKNKTVAALQEGATLSLSKVNIIYGEAEIKDARTITIDGVDYQGEKIIIATGSEPIRLPIPGSEYALTSDDIFNWDEEWKKDFHSLAIIGGGVIGIEFATIFHSLYPDAEITVIEYCKEILPPFDKEIAKRLRTLLSRKGIKFITGTEVKRVLPDNTIEYEKNGKAGELKTEVVIMATGRKPVYPKGIDTMGLATTRRGITVNKDFETNVPGIYAIGDVNGVCMLAHAATAQGKKILGLDVNVEVIPAVVFSTPECAMVGLTEEQCVQAGKHFIVKKSFFRANGKAVTMNETDGMVKLIIDEGTRKLLGAHICGPHASDLIAEAAVIIANNLSVGNIKNTVHAHPTLSEILIAALDE